MAMERTLNLKALAEALGVDKGQLSKESKRPNFPHDMVNGHMLFNVEEVRIWRAKNIRARNLAPKPAAAQTLFESPASSVPAVPNPEIIPPKELSGDEAKHVAVLRNPAASSVEKADATFALACLVVADDYAKRSLGARALEDVKKQSEELRKAREAEMDIRKRRGELIEREVGQQVAGNIAIRLIQCADRFINRLPLQVGQWMIDPFMQDAETRSREIRRWAEEQFYELRKLEAGEIDKMIAECAKVEE